MFNFGRKTRTLYISHIPQEKIYANSLKADLKMIGYSVITTPYDKTERQIKQVCPKIVESVDAVDKLEANADLISSEPKTQYMDEVLLRANIAAEA